MRKTIKTFSNKFQILNFQVKEVKIVFKCSFFLFWKNHNLKIHKFCITF